MRIAFASTILDYPWGGADALWTRAAAAAAERGDRLLLATSAAVASDPAVRAIKGERLVLRHPEVPRTLPKRIGRVLRAVTGTGDPLSDALQRFRPDLIVLSLGGTYDLGLRPGLSRWLERCGVPVRVIANFQVEHPVLAQVPLGVVRSLYPGLDRLFAVSTRNLDVTRRHLGLPLANAEVLHYPLRATAADRTPWPQAGELSFAAIARLEPIKGIDLLLKALGEALGGTPGWRLQVYGRGPDEGALRALAETVGLGDRVAFRGYVGDLRSIWGENHMLVSAAHDEGMPLTLAEAMTCARPVLATDVGGARDWIHPGRNGFICPPGSARELAAALAVVWQSRGQLRAMGERAGLDASAFYRATDYLKVVEPPRGAMP